MDQAQPEAAPQARLQDPARVELGSTARAQPPPAAPGLTHRPTRILARLRLLETFTSPARRSEASASLSTSVQDTRLGPGDSIKPLSILSHIAIQDTRLARAQAEPCPELPFER